jgi:penicillin-binding protein 2
LKEEPLTQDEQQLFSRRELIIRSILCLPIAGIAWRLWDLQIKSGEKYSDLSKGNRIRLKSLPAPRGILYDSNMKILAKNIPSYTMTLVREDTTDVDAVLRRLSSTLKIPISKLKRVVSNYRRAAKFYPIPIYENLTLRQIALVGAYQEQFPGVSIEVSPRRFYPLLRSGSHIYGYMNKITKAQLKKMPLNRLQSAKIIGQGGIEAYYNKEMIGTDGGKQVEVDNQGREIKTFPNSVDPSPGNDIVLSIDSQLQREVERIMGSNKGAAIVQNPTNGHVLAMISMPAFDPNEFSQGLSIKRWNEMKSHPSHVLNNKCIQGCYSPGSTFKMVVAAAAIEMGIIDEDTTISCDGYFRVNRQYFHCWKRSGHGSLNVVEALENSCNVFFNKIAMEVGIDKIKHYANVFGLGQVTKIDLPHEISGVIPDREWKQKNLKKEWLLGDTPNASIGQGFVTVTPLQLLHYINVIANKGILVRPSLVQKIVDNASSEDTSKANTSHRARILPSIRKRIDLQPKTFELLQAGMIQNVQGENGTGKQANSKIVSVAGKTGTTQVVSLRTRERLQKEKGEIEEKYLNHAWFVGYAPAYAPEISTVVLIEHGQSSTKAAKLVRKIVDFYFTNISSYQLQRLNIS